MIQIHPHDECGPYSTAPKSTTPTAIICTVNTTVLQELVLRYSSVSLIIIPHIWICHVVSGHVDVGVFSYILQSSATIHMLLMFSLNVFDITVYGIPSFCLCAHVSGFSVNWENSIFRNSLRTLFFINGEIKTVFMKICRPENKASESVKQEKDA